MQPASFPSKKICIFSGFFPIFSGGSEYQAYLLANVLRAYGHDVFFAGIGGHEKGKYNMEDFRVYILNTNYALRFLGNSTFLLYPQIYAILKKEKPDIVYSRSGAALPGILAIIGKKLNYKFIYGIASDKMLVKSFIEAGMRPFNQIDNLLRLYGMNKADKIISQTTYQKDLLRKNFNIDSIVIRNAHPIPKKVVNKKLEPIKVLFIANYKPIKRPELFVKLAEYFKNVRGIQFIMIGRKGTGPFWREKVETYIKKAENLTHLGAMSQEEVNEYLNTGHILVNTSISEGFSNTFIQAWMRKVPVVSLNVDPDKLLTREGLGLFSFGNFEQLIRNINRLATDHKLRQEIGEKAWRYATNHHSIKMIGDKFCNVLMI